MTIEDLQKVELRVAKVLTAERVEGSEKLIKMQLDAGEKSEDGTSKPRQVIAGIGKVYGPEELMGKSIVIVANLEPRKLMGLESNGMLLAASDQDGNLGVLTVDKQVLPGAGIR